MTPRSAVLVLLVVLAAGLAGCIGAAPGSSGDAVPVEGDGATPSGPGGPGAAGSSAEAALGRTPPTWQVGDHWTYRMSGPDIDREATFVVAEATDQGYVVRSDDPETTFFDARFDISYMGEQSRRLEGSQGEASVRFFDWPLEANATWTTTWDGVERTVAVTGRTVGDDGVTWELEARDPDGGLDVAYTYEGAVGWFGRLGFYENGTETFGMELVSSGSNRSDPYLTVNLTEVVAANFTGVSGFSWDGTVDSSHEDFWVQASWQSDDPGSAGFQYLPPDGGNSDGWGQTPCPCPADSVETTVEATPGNWTWSGGTTLPPAPAGSGGYLDVTVFLRDFVAHEL